mmetsp:Transcript_26244/g.63018  ORF Transcript_26244/g.63018 Transcript_26244/m.63018 type:complete len:85 (+) Transcript_26244:345-599(+)
MFSPHVVKNDHSDDLAKTVSNGRHQSNYLCGFPVEDILKSKFGVWSSLVHGSDSKCIQQVVLGSFPILLFGFLVTRPWLNCLGH